VANHTVLADSQPITLAMQRAPTNARKHHLVTFFIMQEDAGLNAAKRARYLGYDAVNELIQIEDRSNSLRGSLNALQVFNQIRGYRSGDEFAA
jgi:hypothetical protein